MRVRGRDRHQLAVAHVVAEQRVALEARGGETVTQLARYLVGARARVRARAKARARVP